MSSRPKPKAGTIEFISLGCDKNLVDTERALAILKSKGLKPVPSGQGAEILLINSCGFIGPAKQETIEQILFAVERKKKGEIKNIIVAGCMVELNQKELAQAIPEVDLWVKFSEMDQLDKKISLHLGRGLKASSKPAPRLITTPRHLSYLKISEGCDQGCRFCVIPKIRGRFRSEPLDKLLTEAKFLERSGVRELNLVAQDLCEYGKDIDSSLPELIERLLAETSIPWLRLFYLNPEGISDELLEAIRTEKRICKYIDLPFQHISDRVLKAMGRKANAETIRGLVEKIRAEIPEACLRGTAMVGFPGEREIDFQELLDFIEEAGFEWLGVFSFSREAQAQAGRLKGQIPERVARERKEDLEMFWLELAEAKSQAKINKVLEVLVDGGSDLGYESQGRSQGQAYELDGVVQLTGKFEPGKFYPVRIINSQGLDLIGEKILRG